MSHNQILCILNLDDKYYKSILDKTKQKPIWLKLNKFFIFSLSLFSIISPNTSSYRISKSGLKILNKYLLSSKSTLKLEKSVANPVGKNITIFGLLE